MNEELIEELAASEHDRWSRWMKHLFDKCEWAPGDDGTCQTASAIIPPWAQQNWQRQMNTPYADLTEKEKESDRKEARRTIDIVDDHRRVPLLR